jgi:uncharacterized protein YdeI (YjbR/CyaY-like superfamily)
MTTGVDDYFSNAKKWREESEKLRAVILDCGLTEELKWGKPCYASQGKNIVIIQKMKEYVALMFFKGALLNDVHGLLEKPGENSQAGRRIGFTKAQDIIEIEDVLKDYIREATEIEKAGLTVSKTAELVFPEEIQKRLDQDPDLKAAFLALTPGRQRAYNLYFSAAKQPQTREARIEKCRRKILDGKGFQDK